LRADASPRRLDVASGWRTIPRSAEAAAIYTGETIDLHQVQIDHLYALKTAWDAGALKWDPRQRQIFANDMTELIAVSGAANEQKGDSTPGQWLPADPAEKCPYVLRYLAVAVEYQLPITANDRQAAIAACQAGE
jgi:hypothetical protein